MKLVLGSAQIGMNYGLFNNKKISSKEFRRVEKLVLNSKIKFIDTATSYGVSEKIIGNSKLKNLNIITKIKLQKKNNINIEDWVLNKILRTTKLLKISRIYGLLVHDFNDLLGKQGKKYLHVLQQLKRRKIISKIGVSIYDPDEIGKIWKIWKPDIVQFPLNVLDNRILLSGWIDVLKKFKVKMYARSVFLQGLLINNSASLEFSKSYKFYFNRFEDWCSVNDISKVKACLHFVKQYKKIDYLVIGFNNYNHLKEIIDVFKKKQIIVPNKFSTNNINLIDPRRWNYKRKY